MLVQLQIMPQSQGNTIRNLNRHGNGDPAVTARNPAKLTTSINACVAIELRRLSLQFRLHPGFAFMVALHLFMTVSSRQPSLLEHATTHPMPSHSDRSSFR
mmetsp:Transcript_78186/g.154972  ORF Transcript_78186/g.154972 Transcript_78186/m.154972 type:complete len:101 (+) Transcript_78186:173-475(+)